MSSPDDLGYQLIFAIDTFDLEHQPNLKLKCLKNIKKLIDEGADLEVCDDHDHTALLTALRCGVSQKRNVLNMLIFAGADVNAEFVHKWGTIQTPLMNSGAENIQQFIEAGAAVRGTSYKSALCMFVNRFKTYAQKVEHSFAIDVLIANF